MINNISEFIPVLPGHSATVIADANQALTTWLLQSCPSEESRYNYKSDLRGFAQFLKECNCDIFHVTKHHVVAYIESLRIKKRSAATQAKKLTVIKGLFRTLANENLLPYPEYIQIATLKAPKVEKDGKTPGLSPAEARKLLDTPSNTTLQGIRDRAIIAVMLYTGARVSAVCNIKIGHLANEQGIYYVFLHEKASRKIRAPLQKEARDRIQAWIKSSGIQADGKNSYLFRPFKGKSNQIQNRKITQRAIRYLITKHAKTAGLETEKLNQRGISPHSMRVTAITSALAGGAKLEEVMELVGHKDPRNTMRYRKASPKDAQKATQNINYNT